MDSNDDNVWMNQMSSDERAYIIGNAMRIDDTSTACSVMETIMNDDFVANQSAVENNIGDDGKYTWEPDFFKKFEWLNESSDDLDGDIELDMQSLPQEERLSMFLNCCKLVEKNNLSIMNKYEEEDIDEMESPPLYMYYLSLENNKMLLHVDFKKDSETIISDCKMLYEFVQINPPLKIVYVTEVEDLYDVDKDVKLFMNMFGIENMRGGSYTDAILPDFLMKTLLHESVITNINYYVGRNI
jgi:hypothetical protein